MRHLKNADINSPHSMPSLSGLKIHFWNTARSQSQIKGNMYYAADPSDASLLLYLPMGEMKDDAAGRYFEDISGNGHHADILGDRVFRRWIPDVDFKN
jgi:hypothetical protein